MGKQVRRRASADVVKIDRLREFLEVAEIDDEEGKSGRLCGAGSRLLHAILAVFAGLRCGIAFRSLPA
jgi:hypothetical protein